MKVIDLLRVLNIQGIIVICLDGCHTTYPKGYIPEKYYNYTVDEISIVDSRIKIIIKWV